MGKSLAELRRERERLRNYAKARREIAGIQREKNKLQREIKDMKNPRTARFKQLLRRGVNSGGRATMSFLDRLTRPTPVRPTKRRRRR